VILIIKTKGELFIKTQITIVKILLFIVCLSSLNNSFAKCLIDNNTLSPVSTSRSPNKDINKNIFNLTPEKYGREFLKDIFLEKDLLTSLKDGTFIISDINKFKSFKQSLQYYQLVINELEKNGVLEKTSINEGKDLYQIEIKNIYKYFIETRHIAQKDLLKKIMLLDEETFFIIIKEILSKKRVIKRDMIFLCEVILLKFREENDINLSDLNDVSYYLKNVLSGVTSYFADGALFLGHVIFFRNINSKLMEGISDAAEGVESIMELEERLEEASNKIIADPALLSNLFKILNKTFPLKSLNHIDVIANLFINYFFITEEELVNRLNTGDIAKLNAKKVLQQSIFYIKKIIKMQLEWFVFVEEILGNQSLNKVDHKNLTILMKILENEIPISIVYGMKKFNNRVLFLERMKEIEKEVLTSS